VKFWRNLAVVAVFALLLTLAPGGGATLRVVITVLTIAFFALIALFGARLYREHRMSLDALPERHRQMLYGSVGLAFLTFVATDRLFDLGGGGLLLWLALLGACSYAIFWVYARAREY
jgi:O-antigen/teichoic acid export membrane protein